MIVDSNDSSVTLMHCWWEANWCSHCGKQYGGSSKLKTELAYDLVTSLLAIYSRKIKTLIKKDTAPLCLFALYPLDPSLLSQIARYSFYG